jgi:hypothetical protein
MTVSPVDVVQRQFDCYNRRDLDAFCECFAEDIALFEWDSTTPNYVGKDALRERYRNLFEQSPALNCQLANRIALGRVVVDHERITGRMGAPEVLEILALYDVDGGLIRSIRFVRTQP